MKRIVYIYLNGMKRRAVLVEVSGIVWCAHVRGHKACQKKRSMEHYYKPASFHACALSPDWIQMPLLEHTHCVLDQAGRRGQRKKGFLSVVKTQHPNWLSAIWKYWRKPTSHIYRVTWLQWSHLPYRHCYSQHIEHHIHWCLYLALI